MEGWLNYRTRHQYRVEGVFHQTLPVSETDRIGMYSSSRLAFQLEHADERT